MAHSHSPQATGRKINIIPLTFLTAIMLMAIVANNVQQIHCILYRQVDSVTPYWNKRTNTSRCKPYCASWYVIL